MIAARIVFGEEVELPNYTRDAAGHVVDLTGSKWRLNSAEYSRTSMNWNRLDGCDGVEVAAEIARSAAH